MQNNQDKEALILEIQAILNALDVKKGGLETDFDISMMQELDSATLMQIRESLLSKQNKIDQEWLFSLVD